jgi:ankyrin repeat protein
VDVNHRITLFGSPLYNAAAVNNAGIVKLLLEKGADINKNGGRPLYAATAYADVTDALSLLIAAGADIKSQGRYATNNNRTPLIPA